MIRRVYLSTEAEQEMIRLRHQRAGKESTDEDGNVSCQVLLGFTLDLPEAGSRRPVLLVCGSWSDKRGLARTFTREG